MYRIPFALAAMATLVVSSLPLMAERGPRPAQGAQPGQAQESMPKPSNLKVLPKDISPDDLMAVMHGFTQQLGVKCGFCHAGDATPRHLNFASDEKPTKNIARTMMAMTSDMNNKYLSQLQVPDAKPAQKSVTCGTCHRGHSLPEVYVPADQQQGTTAPKK